MTQYCQMCEFNRKTTEAKFFDIMTNTIWYSPKVIINHHNQLLSLEANSVECWTINVHFAKDSPNPERAPYREAIVWQKHMSSKNPIQLNTKATANMIVKDWWNHTVKCLTEESYKKHKICTQKTSVCIICGFVTYCNNSLIIWSREDWGL